MNTDVARILGWYMDYANGSDAWKSWFDASGNRRDPFNVDYTADDLAAWLADRDYWVNISNAWDDDGQMRQWQISAAIIEGDGYNEPVFDVEGHEAIGATILEALEQLVLQIGTQ